MLPIRARVNKSRSANNAPVFVVVVRGIWGGVGFVGSPTNVIVERIEWKLPCIRRRCLCAVFVVVVVVDLARGTNYLLQYKTENLLEAKLDLHRAVEQNVAIECAIECDMQRCLVVAANEQEKWKNK